MFFGLIDTLGAGTNLAVDGNDFAVSELRTDQPTNNISLSLIRCTILIVPKTAFLQSVIVAPRKRCR